ncbi:MAG: precorrin-6y C5,15-methyltransferase (decarboxylating) subunit CbiE [Bacteroidota bacterium]
MKFHVIGIGNKKLSLSQEMERLVKQHSCFSGGERHYQLVKHLLPEHHSWVAVKSPLEEVYRKYDETEQDILVFASGDPLFYGYSNTLKNRYPKAQIYTYPYFSSIQLLASKAGLNSNELRTVSVHGRTWADLDEAIIRQEPLVGVLTDQGKSPAAIAAYLLRYGYSNYTVYLGEDLEGEHEKVEHISLQELSLKKAYSLNCLILKKEEHRNVPFGIPDEEFKGLPERPNMITKMAVRLSSLHYLDLGNKKVLWDLGFCTGSLSIEAKLRFPKLEIYAFEKREECGELIQRNQEKFGSTGINSIIQDIYELDFSAYPKPEAVFIGGHGGRLPELIEKLNAYVSVGTSIVINAVQESSFEEFTQSCVQMGWSLEHPVQIRIDQHNEITILKAVK